MANLDTQRQEVVDALTVVRDNAGQRVELSAPGLQHRVLTAIRRSLEADTLLRGEANATLMQIKQVCDLFDLTDDDDVALARLWQRTVEWLTLRASDLAARSSAEAHAAADARLMRAAARHCEAAAKFMRAADDFAERLGGRPARQAGSYQRDWPKVPVTQIDGWQVYNLRWSNGATWIGVTSKPLRGAVRRVAREVSVVRERLEGDPETPSVSRVRRFDSRQDASFEMFRRLHKLAQDGVEMLNRSCVYWELPASDQPKECEGCTKTLKLSRFPVDNRSPDGRRQKCQMCHRLEQRFIGASQRQTGSGADGYRALKAALRKDPDLAHRPSSVITERVRAAFPTYNQAST